MVGEMVEMFDHEKRIEELEKIVNEQKEKLQAFNEKIVGLERTIEAVTKSLSGYLKKS